MVNIIILFSKFIGFFFIIALCKCSITGDWNKNTRSLDEKATKIQNFREEKYKNSYYFIYLIIS